MKSNNLNKVENTLRSIAKRYKSIKYSLGLAILFLMMGVSAFSEEVVQQEVPTAEQISTSKENLKGSLGNLQSKIETARKENEKSLAGLKLELIQLMEQGDQVVKMPWSSWQYGVGYIYNSWGKAYKGYGDKKEGSETLVRDTSGSLKRFLENSSASSSSYGSTNLAMVSEPAAEIEVSAGIRPKSINKEAPSYTPVAPAGALPPFEPKLISPPGKPSAPREVSPTNFNPPALNFVGTGFWQNWRIGSWQNGTKQGVGLDSSIIIENYENYKTDAAHTQVNPFDIVAGTGTYKGVPIADGMKWTGKLKAWTKNGENWSIGGTVVRNFNFEETLISGYHSSAGGWGKSAFINELRDHDAVIEGHYRMTYLGGDPINTPAASYTKMFISYNPAGRETGEAGTVAMAPMTGWLGQSAKRTATFKGTLELNGSPNTSPHGSLYEILAGVEHQLWDSQDNRDGYSNFVNEGDMILKSGNNVIGIMIDSEALNEAGRTKHKNNTTNNKGRIIVENKNSIGIDFGLYAIQNWLPLDVTLGNIIVKGENNYGFRMKNIGQDTYYDDVTISGGGSNKTITVAGKHNVGLAIGKSLSANPQPYTEAGNLNHGTLNKDNPISNFHGVNVNVMGEETVGFLRLADSYTGNTKDFILTDGTGKNDTHATMGTFTFGNGAKKSTLIRTDKYGIQVRGNITAVGKNDTGVGNTVLHSNGETQHINNYKTITIGKGFTQTTGMAATGSTNSTIVNILNEGTISLQGKKSIGMYVDKFTQGKSTGTIKLSGIGDKDKSGNVGDAENVGISNKGKFTFSGTLEVNGKKSSGIYNTGETTIAVGSSPTAKTNITVTNGATALYSKGAGTKIESTAGNKLNITVNAGTTKEGLAVYAEDKSQVTLHNANINVNGGSAGVASYNAGTKVDLTGATLKYNGDGYAVYSDGKGEIELKNSNIELRGSSTLMELDWSIAPGSRPIKTSGTNVKVFSNDVVAINVSNLGTRNLSTLSALKSLLGVNITAGTEGGKTFNKYKELAIENGEINFDVATDKAAADTTPGGFFFKKVLGQRLRLNVNQNLTARLSSAIAEEFYNKQVVGLEANSSKQATSNTETQVNIANGKVVDVARTDGTDNGGVGVFINYGLVDNNGTINVEKDSVANSNAVGVYAVNGSEVKNNGTINVSGKDSIGILGVAYRTDSKNKNVVDEFGKSATGQGKVNILNKGNINLDGQGATGIFAKNNKAGATLTNAIATNDTTGKITTTGIKSVGMSGEKANIINRGTINVNGQEGTGMFAKSSSRMENSGTINITASTSASKPNIGMFTEDQNTEIHNNKNIVGGNNTYGIYGKTINMGTNGKIKVGNNSVGIYSNGQYTSSVTPTVNLASGSTIEVGNNQAVGVFTTGKNQNISSQADMKIGDNSYGYVVRGTGTRLTTNSPNPVTVGNDTVFAYSTDRSGTIVNRTTLTSTGSKNYGIYAAGNSTNLGDINFGSGVGNVGMYSISGGRAINGSATINSIIRVSASDKTNKLFGIGMAAGYTDDNGVVHQTGTVENYGTIKVEKDNGIGMYATGRGSKAINRGNIELSGKSTTGMYLDNNAIGENYGTIKTVPNPTNTGIIGVVALNGAVIKNYGTIEIKGNNNTGIYLAKGKREGADPIATDGATDVKEKKQADTSKKVSGIEIKAPGDGTATIKRNGKVVTPTYVDTTVASAKAPKVRVGNTELDLRASGLGNLPSISRASELGMYVDTSGVNYTNPIKGLEKLTGLKKVNLIFGTEAARYTTSKNIQVGTNILKPYNNVITTLSAGGNEKKFAMTSASLTWIATGTQNTDDTFKSVYLVKIPYTSFAKDKDTYNFMDGLEKRYGVEGVGSREKELFDKLNGIGKGEPRLLAQAVDEMKGHQYSNIEQRINSTSQILDKEISNLSKEWSNLSKNANKLKTFGLKGEYKSETSGVVDYKNYAYGVVYKNENEDIKLGRSIGWYAGIVHNTFKFKDLGKSKEQMLEGKVGLFKSVPFDDNNSLNWTISGDIFVGYSRMNRKFLVVDEIFNAKANYHIYGIGVKNEIGKAFRLSEDFALRPYVALKAEYGRMSKIKEKNGQMKLEVKQNDYISIRPEVGTELSYRHYFGTKTLRTSIGVAYENELGKVGSVKNKVRVGNTTSDWYNLRGEKEDRKGNVKFDLNLGLDNQIYGVTANVGYDTKGENVRGGLGLRVIF
ncbi:autotransporter-associated N-terminal domain-containing protein [Fusobacterium polymorphum]|uniref:autotransporter-associated N-terminal domain-containing protein n=1 Tax=Fusobacterium nucleatum subsp. polymorphum TaxID=76857 RepID=UPI00300A64F0